jgi:enoyl-CoA hydratase/carnithine racemase
MAFTNITLDQHERVGTLTLNRPEKLNAMTPALIGEFADALTQVEKDSAIKVLIIRGAGRAFSTGYDLTGGWGDGGSKPFTIDDDHRFLLRYVEHWLRLRDLPKPVISMVHLHRYDFRRRERAYRISLNSRRRGLCQRLLELDGRSPPD